MLSSLIKLNRAKLQTFFSRNRNLIFLVFCFVLVFLIYGQTLGGNFVFDDRYIASSSDTFLVSNLAQVITSPYWSTTSGLYRPTTLASYALNYSLFGTSPWSFHFLNLIFYAWSGYLIFILIKKIFKQDWLAFLAAILFLVLPIHTEAVANIVGRAEILALFFSLLFFWELSREKIRPVIAGLWLLLALGSKETATATIPLGLILLLLIKENTSLNLKKYKDFGLSVLVGLIYFGARLQVLGWSYFKSLETSLVENPLLFASPLERIATAFKILWLYLQKTFWPINLCSDYSYNQIPVLKNFGDISALAGLAIFILFIAAIFIFWQRKPLIAWTSSIFVLSFLIIGNILFPTGTIAGERLMYYPSLGLIILLAYLLSSSASISLKWLIIIASSSLIIFYAYESQVRSLAWLTESALFKSAAECAPNSVLSRSNLGATYYLAGALDKAKQELLSAQAIYDKYPKGLNNLGLVYWRQGQRDLAKKYFLKALDFKFPYTGAYENLALMALEEKNIPEAKKWLELFYDQNELLVNKYLQDHLTSQVQTNQ